MESTIKFSPMIPWAAPFDVQKRLEQLRGFLDPNNPHYQPKRQHVNIKAAIKLYEEGKIDGEKKVFIMNGKIIDKKEILKGPDCSWSEGKFHQYALTHSYGQGPYQDNFHKVSASF
ncbi:uncharacterized protein Z518_04603 [Rhinocladiella mackenziei CBS 650.93]|uniref:Uncharacterized protein n=1 Tax=Rhinocladiella mackenziei CBS 650.93 TaxID=1442369 RepID=A0A0D2FWM0_9EURO|nr:uncharacterized protein Z518_04603 [Rhinocladiella mackenziei CBS 650.93]KIX06627.1 hypothetical protein Z518_04603 [Rhinocladiella mackenziei CBS 650.93]